MNDLEIIFLIVIRWVGNYIFSVIISLIRYVMMFSLSSFYRYVPGLCVVTSHLPLSLGTPRYFFRYEDIMKYLLVNYKIAQQGWQASATFFENSFFFKCFSFYQPCKFYNSLKSFNLWYGLVTYTFIRSCNSNLVLKGFYISSSKSSGNPVSKSWYGVHY